MILISYFDKSWNVKWAHVTPSELHWINMIRADKGLPLAVRHDWV